jgi:voltage-gated potassium channel
VVPALRIARIARLVRIARGVRLFRVYASTNRGLHAVMQSLGRKGAGYVIAMTVVVTYAGAAGMYALEDGLFHSYWDALWWTAMIMTTMGSEAWPKTPLGRLLCFVLALYAFSIFGYVTATLASFLVGRDDDEEKVGLSKVEQEIAALRSDMSAVRAALAGAPPAHGPHAASSGTAPSPAPPSAE